MSPDQIAIVQDSFRKVVPIAATAADLFYDRLFAIAPDVRPLFPENLAEQKKKLVAMLAAAVSNLHQVETIAPAVADLGKRHFAKGKSCAPETARKCQQKKGDPAAEMGDRLSRGCHEV